MSLAGKTVLIIDDADDIRALARRVLETDGATVHDSASISEGIQKAEEINPHLIVTDLNFDGADGFFFLEQRRTSTSLMSIPTIVLSGLSDRVSIVKAVALGASDYLLKPFRATLLLQKARKHLRVASFAAHNFAEGALEPVSVNVPAEIMFLTESGFQVETAVKLAADQLIEMESEFLESSGVENVLLKSSSRAPGYVGPGRYANQILFTGVGEEFARKMRKVIKE
jgi:CheY-like chemotaxis protein